MNFFKDWIGPMPTREFRRDGQPQGAGCGDKKTDMFIPDFFPKACAAHDACYAEQCGQAFCDSNFYRDMRAERPDMSVAPWVYYKAVDVMGGDAYRAVGKKP
jgi:hypothetical protein